MKKRLKINYNFSMITPNCSELDAPDFLIRALFHGEKVVMEEK